MAATKIVDSAEADRWLRAGKSNQWLIEQYERKYKITTTKAMWSNRRARLNLPTHTVHDPDLMPWKTLAGHRASYLAEMLYAEARLRAGKELTPAKMRKLENFKRTMAQDRTVVDYNQQDGFFVVPRRPGIDISLIRVPDVTRPA